MCDMYVIQVRTGSEENIVIQCQRIIREQNCEGSVLRKCFIPYYEKQRRYEGAWHTERKMLFPGYVFLVSDDPEQLKESLRSVIGMSRLLGIGDKIVPLTAEEVCVLQKLGGDSQIVEASMGVIEKDEIRITSGPLQGMEGCIKKIDRHKRLAWLEITMMGRIVETQVGLEIVEKR